jgi:pyridoxal phosphate enzyme (YggS family)
MTVADTYRELLRANIKQVQNRIAEAAQRAGRDPAEVTLVAVSKTRGAEQCALAVELGLGILGENRVQEAREKIPQVAGLLTASGTAPPVWHLVGHLQSNKAGKAVAMFQMIQSVDDYKLAMDINRHAQASGKVQDCLLEVNTSGEESKFGVSPDCLLELWQHVRELPNINLLGLMTVGPFSCEESASRHAFARLRELGETVRKQTGDAACILSMGMTGDMEWAIAEGSTMVRVGTAIFGERQY